ncbi:MAG: HPr family phosphocarrier protein [Ruminococcus sp.]|nr:HPr family phosphocarrier protein [Ruminococcus sp.]
MFSKTAIVMKGIFLKRPTAILQTAYTFRSDIWIEKNDKKVDAKKLPDILNIHIKGGDTITFTANGEDEIQAIETLVNLVENDYLLDIF